MSTSNLDLEKRRAEIAAELAKKETALFGSLLIGTALSLIVSIVALAVGLTALFIAGGPPT